MSIMNEEELQNLVEQISLRYFNRPFKYFVKINHRMKTTGGRYHLNDHHLEINAHFLEEKNQKYLPGIIKHELVHYHLHLMNKGYRHKDRDFKQLLKEVNGLRYAPDIGQRKFQKRKYLYQCTNCGLRYPRARKINIQCYFCGACHGKLKILK